MKSITELLFVLSAVKISYNQSGWAYYSGEEHHNLHFFVMTAGLKTENWECQLSWYLGWDDRTNHFNSQRFRQTVGMYLKCIDRMIEEGKVVSESAARMIQMLKSGSRWIAVERPCQDKGATKACSKNMSNTS